MTNKQKAAKMWNAACWAAQVILSVSFIWSAGMKLFYPADKLAEMWPWTGEHAGLVKLTGVVDLLAGLGLVLPALLGIQPRLTTYAAYGTIVLMIAASAFHFARGEGSQIGVNVFFLVFAIFIAWGRSKTV
jgi:hypothetical protein